MPDLSPFPTDAPTLEGGKPNGASEPAAPATPDPQAAMQQFSHMLGQAVSQAVAPLHQQLGTLRQEMDSMRRPATPAPTPNAGEDSTFVDRFVANPEETLEKFMQPILARAVGPYLAPVHEASRDAALAQQRARVDHYYGSGTYDELLGQHIERTVGELSEPMRANQRAITRIVDAYLGSEEMRGELEKRREGHMKAEQEAAKARVPQFLGSPGRGTPREDVEVGAEDRAAMEALARVGMKVDESKWRLAGRIPKGLDADAILAYSSSQGDKK